MQADLKPKNELQKRKKQKTSEAKAKPKPEPKAKAKFLVRKHKRACPGEGNEYTFIAAIYDNTNLKQIGQLTHLVSPDYEQIVKDLVQSLNEGQKTAEEAVEELNKLKNT